MIRRTHTVFLLLALVLAPQIVSAQATTGTPPFGSFAGGSVDTVDLANLNVNFAIPIMQKPGRGLPFHYVMDYNSSIWVPTAVGSSKTWQPVNTNWGWTAQSEALTGSVPMSHSWASCFVTNPDSGLRTKVQYPITIYSGYEDPNGTFHSAWIMTTPGYDLCDSGPVPPVYSGSSAANDGSGYLLNVNEQASPSVVVQNRSGWSIPSPGSSTGAVIDTNGNELTTSVNGTTTTFTETLGTTVLTVSSPSSSQTTYSYTAPSGSQVQIAFNYTQKTVQTAFGCSGITEYPATPVYLVTSITLPDSTSYTITYEQTNGAASGVVTGRIASIKLPTGGTISYQYSSGGTGINGITCADGSASYLARTTPDGTWTYSQGGGTTTITDPVTPAGNMTVINFQGIFATQQQIYQGTILPANLVRTINTCYNGSPSPCTGTAITLPITQRTVTEVLAGSGSLQCKHIYKYNSYGSMTEQDDYDYGPSAPPSTPLRKTLIGYATLSNNILDRPASVTVQDGGSHTIASTTYNYDETAVVTPTNLPTPQHTSISGSRGNVTSTNYPVIGLSAHFTYFDTGNLQTSKDVNGATTSYTYGALTATCGNTFPTGVTEAVNTLTQAMTWNCNGGVMTQLTDENGQNISASYTDPYFWRPASTTDQASLITNITYSGQNALESALNFNSGNSTSDRLTTLDGLGRPHVQQSKQSPTSTSYDSVETDYDALGRPSRTTLPYTATAGQITSPTGPGVTTTYDAVGRPLTVTDAGGGTTTYSYSNNDVLITLGPAPAGENTKRRQLEYDALGRLTSVCEITSGSQSGSCGQTSAQTGYLTKYTYDTLGNLTGVTQNAQTGGTAQTRGYSYDAMNRLTSETNAESGTISYTYDSATGCTGTYAGDIVKRVDAVGNTFCYTYDALHRKLSVTYPSGSYASVTPSKYFVYDSATVNGVAMANTKSRVAEAYTCFSPCSSKTTDTGFTYTVRGEVSDVFQLTPHSSPSYYRVSQTYWPHRAPSQLSSNITGLPAINYGGTIGSTVGLDGEGRITQVTASGTGQQNPVTGVTYNNSSLPTQVTFGSADTDIFAYDANTMRMTQYQFNINGQSDTGALTWNANSSLQKLVVSDAFNTADNQTCNYSHDDLSRIAQANCGTAASQTFSYDPFGNISKSGSPYSFQPTYSSGTNRFSTIPGASVSYDANGNVLTDGSHTYAWDADGNAVSLDGVGLTFDALDRMVEQNRSGTYSEIVYSPSGAKLALMSGTGGQTLQRAFVPLPGQATAVYSSSGLDHYRHSDWLGSARLTSSPTRTVVSTNAYAPFGETYAQFGTPDLSFTGQNQDTVSGDYDFLAREYSIQGRWPSPDPAGLDAVDPTNPQSWNRYAYVVDDPLYLVDPTGMFYGPCGPLDELCPPSSGGGGGIFGGGGGDEYPSLIFLGGRGGGGSGGNSSSSTNKPGCRAGQSNGTTTIVSGSYTNSTPTVALGTAIGGYLAGPPGAAIGGIIGSYFGVGISASWVPSTNSWYAGPTVAAGIVPGGGSGFNVSAVTVPSNQNPNAIANHLSLSATWQPMPTAGATVTKSPGSGPAVAGYSTGSRVPASGSASFSICVTNCGCS
jgi:RHS repeat-associated protein